MVSTPLFLKKFWSSDCLASIQKVYQTRYIIYVAYGLVCAEHVLAYVGWCSASSGCKVLDIVLWHLKIEFRRIAVLKITLWGNSATQLYFKA